MENILKFKKAIVYQILITAAVFAAGALIFNQMPAAKGFVLGSLFSLINFLFMVRHTPNRLGKERKAATVHSGLSLVFRLGILAVPLYLAIRRPEINLVFTIIGIFNLQISIIIYGLLVERFLYVDRPSTRGHS